MDTNVICCTHGKHRMEFDFWNFLGGVIAGGLGGSLLTIQISKKLKIKVRGNAVDQSQASAGGDIVGRDKR